MATSLVYIASNVQPSSVAAYQHFLCEMVAYLVLIPAEYPVESVFVPDREAARVMLRCASWAIAARLLAVMRTPVADRGRSPVRWQMQGRSANASSTSMVRSAHSGSLP